MQIASVKISTKKLIQIYFCKFFLKKYQNKLTLARRVSLFLTLQLAEVCLKKKVRYFQVKTKFLFFYQRFLSKAFFLYSYGGICNKVLRDLQNKTLMTSKNKFCGFVRKKIPESQDMTSIFTRGPSLSLYVLKKGRFTNLETRIKS